MVATVLSHRNNISNENNGSDSVYPLTSGDKAADSSLGRRRSLSAALDHPASRENIDDWLLVITFLSQSISCMTIRQVRHFLSALASPSRRPVASQQCLCFQGKIVYYKTLLSTIKASQSLSRFIRVLMLNIQHDKFALVSSEICERITEHLDCQTIFSR